MTRDGMKTKPYTLKSGSENKAPDLFSTTGRGTDFEEEAAVWFFFSAFLGVLTRMD